MQAALDTRRDTRNGYTGFWSHVSGVVAGLDLVYVTR